MKGTKNKVKCNMQAIILLLSLGSLKGFFRIRLPNVRPSPDQMVYIQRGLPKQYSTPSTESPTLTFTEDQKQRILTEEWLLLHDYDPGIQFISSRLSTDFENETSSFIHTKAVILGFASSIQNKPNLPYLAVCLGRSKRVSFPKLKAFLLMAMPDTAGLDLRVVEKDEAESVTGFKSGRIPPFGFTGQVCHSSPGVAEPPNIISIIDASLLGAPTSTPTSTEGNYFVDQRVLLCTGQFDWFAAVDPASVVKSGILVVADVSERKSDVRQPNRSGGGSGGNTGDGRVDSVEHVLSFAAQCSLKAQSAPGVAKHLSEHPSVPAPPAAAAELVATHDAIWWARPADVEGAGEEEEGWRALGVPIHLIGVVVSKRAVSKRLVFLTLAPPSHPFPPSTAVTDAKTDNDRGRRWRVWNSPLSDAAEGRAGGGAERVTIQCILGDTLIRRLGPEAAQQVMRGLRCGQKVYMTGLMRPHPNSNPLRPETVDIATHSIRVLEELQPLPMKPSVAPVEGGAGLVEELTPYLKELQKHRQKHKRLHGDGGLNLFADTLTDPVSGSGDGQQRDFLSMDFCFGAMRGVDEDSSGENTEERLLLVDDISSLVRMRNELFDYLEPEVYTTSTDSSTGEYRVIGVDCEWRPDGRRPDTLPEDAATSHLGFEPLPDGTAPTDDETAMTMKPPPLFSSEQTSGAEARTEGLRKHARLHVELSEQAAIAAAVSKPRRAYRVQAGRGRNSPVALLQLATPRRAYLIDLCSLCTILTDGCGRVVYRDPQEEAGLTESERLLNECLCRIFHSERVVKVGLGPTSDLRRLAWSLPHLSGCRSFNTVLDIQHLAQKAYPGVAKSSVEGLSKLYQHVYGRPVDKTEQCSDWAARPLSSDQIAYAALDAMLLSRLFDTLRLTSVLAVYPFEALVHSLGLCHSYTTVFHHPITPHTTTSGSALSTSLSSDDGGDANFSEDGDVADRTREIEDDDAPEGIPLKNVNLVIISRNSVKKRKKIDEL